MALIDLEAETIASLGARMAAGELSARDLTQHCLDRIAKYDSTLNAIIDGV